MLPKGIGHRFQFRGAGPGFSNRIFVASRAAICHYADLPDLPQ